MNKASKEELKEELAALGSSLPSYGKEPDFRVPDHYFDHLPQSIQEKISTQRRPAGIFLAGSYPRRLALALISLVVLVVFSFGLFFLRQGSEDGLFSGTEEDGPEVFFSLYADMDPYLWYEMILETDITADEIYFGAESETAESEDEAMMDYLYERIHNYELGAGEYIDPMDEQ
ncbi:MAG: hypothetical protein R6U86_03650 [Bacteroidales bacterium]